MNPATTGWTAASLLPSLAASQVWAAPALRPAKVVPEVGAKVQANRTSLINRVLGSNAKATPPKQQDINPTVNSLSTVGYDYQPQSGKLI